MSAIKRDGYNEAVVFALVKDGKLLIERRPGEKGEEVFIPNGGVEETDKQNGKNYFITALKREAREEMNLEITKWEYLMDLKVDEIKVWFYVFIVTDWNGDVPNFTVEPPGSNQKFADLEWININDYEKVFEYDSAKTIAKEILNKYL